MSSNGETFYYHTCYNCLKPIIEYFYIYLITVANQFQCLQTLHLAYFGSIYRIKYWLKYQQIYHKVFVLYYSFALETTISI